MQEPPKPDSTNPDSTKPDSTKSGKLRQLARLSGADKWLLLQAIVALAVARVQLVTLPFERLAARLSDDSMASDNHASPELLARIARAVQVAAAHVPWDASCFPQAIAAGALLKRHGLRPTVHLGVERQGDTELLGHAWLTCGNAMVIGGENLDKYTEVHRFSR